MLWQASQEGLDARGRDRKAYQKDQQPSAETYQGPRGRTSQGTRDLRGHAEVR